MSELKIEQWIVDDLKPYDLNAKIHNEQQVARIAESITKFGWDQPIVVDKDGVIIKGHGRRLAAIKLGLIDVPVLVRTDLSDEQVRAARLADNRVAIGDLDAGILKQELEDFNLDFLDGIFDDKELNFMMSDMTEMNLDAIVVDLDEAVAAQNQETMQRLIEADERPVRVDKALGFKEVQGRDERTLARFMAVAEGETGLEGASAFVTYIKKVMEAA